MIRIGIVGSDNSHALAYARLANVERIAGDACRVVAIWGQEAARTREVAAQGQIPTIVAHYEELRGAVDLVLVVDRHGDLHTAHALPFLTDGTSVYVDKPFAIAPDDCARMIAAARQSGAPLTSFSALRVAPATIRLAEEAARLGEIRAAHFVGPCDFASQYGGPFFYATHVIEVAFRLLGEAVTSVLARRHGTTVAVQVAWQDGPLATLTYLGDAAYTFQAALYGTAGHAGGEIAGGDAAYGAALQEMLAMCARGSGPLSDEQLLRPIAMVHAIQRSLASGEVVTLAG